MDDADPTGRWRLHTAWRAGSRRAVVECLGLCWTVREMVAGVDADHRNADLSSLYDPGWYAQQAVALGYITPDQAAALVGDDATAARAVMKSIWDFGTDPAFSPGSIDWSLDWPENTPPDQVGPRRRREAVSKIDHDHDRE